MFDIETPLIIAAFIAGLFMFLAPCTLPLVPGYIAFISGFKTGVVSSRKKILLNSLAFVFGFSSIFILFGILIGFIGSALIYFRDFIMYVGGVVIIVLGLLMLRIIKIPFLTKIHTTKFPTFIQPGHPFSAFLMGSIFATGWSPCIGPVLASILLLASTTGSVITGGVLLCIFSLGLGIPFLVTALLYTQAEQLIQKYANIAAVIHEMGAIFMILIGVLLVTNNFDVLIEYGFKIFGFLGYESLMRFY